MMQRHKYNNSEPNAIDFFGECMTSPKNGRTPLADEIYVSQLNVPFKYTVLKFNPTTTVYDLLIKCIHSM
jgi:hypothetical protein